MSKHTSDEPGSRADRAGTPGQALQPELAFVVQLRAGPQASRDGLQGRVEHVVSGEVLRFRSTAELVEFLTRGAPPAPAERPARGATTGIDNGKPAATRPFPRRSAP